MGHNTCARTLANSPAHFNFVHIGQVDAHMIKFTPSNFLYRQTIVYPASEAESMDGVVPYTSFEAEAGEHDTSKKKSPWTASGPPSYV